MRPRDRFNPVNEVRPFRHLSLGFELTTSTKKFRINRSYQRQDFCAFYISS
jgi:hypothetical protein